MIRSPGANFHPNRSTDVGGFGFNTAWSSRLRLRAPRSPRIIGQSTCTSLMGSSPNRRGMRSLIISMIFGTPSSGVAISTMKKSLFSPALGVSGISPRLIRWALTMIRLSAACRNTSVNRATGRRPEPMIGRQLIHVADQEQRGMLRDGPQERVHKRHIDHAGLVDDQKAPPVKNKLAERIMAEADTLRMIGLESKPRNRALLTLLYGGGLRIAEVCGLCWRDLAEREDGGQATVYGKGGKTRVVLLSASTWRLLLELGTDVSPDDPLFRSRLGGHLNQSQVHRIVKAAARRAGLSIDVSAHWLRHAHASHALDRGAPIHLVQATLGHASVATTGRYLHARPSESSSRFLGV